MTNAADDFLAASPAAAANAAAARAAAKPVAAAVTPLRSSLTSAAAAAAAAVAAVSVRSQPGSPAGQPNPAELAGTASDIDEALVRVAASPDAPAASKLETEAARDAAEAATVREAALAPHSGIAAASAPRLAVEELPSSSTVEHNFPGSFCAELWRSVAGPDGLFSAILAHPFLRGVADGSLEEESFFFYLVQDELYLREYARALALVAAKAPRPDWTAFFCQCARGAYQVETSFHKELLAHFGTTAAAACAGAAPCPASLLYTSWLLATVHGRAFYEGLAAVLPCFIVYLEVGRALLQRGSPHPLYQQWLDQYGGAEFEGLVLQVVAVANEVAAELGPVQRQRMLELFHQGCRLEYLFWDGAYRRQQWPL